jgi:alpha-mannosidase
MIGDGRKMEYQQLAVIRGGEILRDSLRNIAERVQVPIANSFPIVVFNPLGWTRDDVVRTHVTLYGDVSPADLGAFRKGMKLLDEKGQPVAFHLEQYSENISRAVEIVFVAKDVPSIGYRTYYLVPSEEPEVRPNTAQIELDREQDMKNPRRAVGSDVVESEHYRVSVDRATGRVTVFDKALKRNVSEGMEIAAVEERGGNYIGIEPLSGRTILSMVDDIRVEENNPVRTVIKIALHLGDIPIEQRLILYSGLKRLDIQNTVDWKTQRFIRLQQWFPLSQPNPKLTYGIPFGANSSDNVLPNSGTHAADEIPMEDWRRSRHFHDWMRAGNDEWGLTIAADHQQMRFDDQLIRAEMLRGVKFTSVKVVRGEDVGSMAYPVPGRYVFRYSLSSSTGDWKSTKAYRTGMNFTNPLAAVSVVDAISRKTLAPAQSFVSVKQDSVVISTIKKADAGNSVLLRVYEIEGKPVESGVDFLGAPASFTEVNLIEEDVRGSRNTSLRAGPYSIRTLKLEPRGGTR